MPLGLHAPFHGPALWTEIFGNDHPVAVEIGPGRGEFLLLTAAMEPEQNFFAVERSRPRARALEVKLEAAHLRNVRVVAGDAGCLLELLPDACVATYFIQFPDPWWKRRHRRRRLLTETLIATMARTLVPGGAIHLVTDVAEYFDHAQRMLDADQNLERVQHPDSGNTAETSFARKASSRGSQLWKSTHRRQD